MKHIVRVRHRLCWTLPVSTGLRLVRLPTAQTSVQVRSGFAVFWVRLNFLVGLGQSTRIHAHTKRSFEVHIAGRLRRALCDRHLFLLRQRQRFRCRIQSSLLGWSLANLAVCAWLRL